ncbi:MAG: HTH domain-containing protein [Chromatiaceae bacterium]|nr:MAG: HTH domain-containing protein [Chromatiaceae bacterium]
MLCRRTRRRNPRARQLALLIADQEATTTAEIGARLGCSRATLTRRIAPLRQPGVTLDHHRFGGQGGGRWHLRERSVVAEIRQRWKILNTPIRATPPPS